MIGQLDSTSHAQLDVIESIDAISGIKSEWKALLADGAVGGNLFNDPDHVLLQLRFNSDWRPRIVIRRQAGRIQCIAPFYLCNGRLPLQISVFTLASLPRQIVKLFGDDTIMSADANPAECFPSVIAALWQRRSEAAIIYLENLQATSLLWQYCHTMGTGRDRFRSFLASPQIEKVHQLCLPATFQDFQSSLSAETRQSARRKTRKLQQQTSAQLICVADPDQVPRFVAAVDRVMHDSWQSKTFGPSQRDSNSRIEYLTNIAQAGWLRSYLLANATEPLAFVVGYQYQGVYYYENPGFVQSWSRFGPGAVLLNLLIEDLYRSNRPVALDFGIGDAGYKRSVANRHHEAAPFYIVPRNSCRIFLSAQRALYGLERIVRGSLSALKLDRVVRKYLKNQS